MEARHDGNDDETGRRRPRPARRGGAALVRCGIGNVAVEKAFPAGDHLVEGDPARNNAIIRFSLPADCFASTKPQTICNRLIGTMYNPGDSRLK